MAKETGIAWTDATFNIAWGCVKVSPGCDNCYADNFASRTGFDVWGKDAERRVFGDKHWNEPEKWDRLAAQRGESFRVFCSSMCDIGEDHPVIREQLARLWALIRRTPWLDWQLLTKRAGRWPQILPPDWGEGWPNVWLGVSVENMDYAWRVEALRKIPARIRFISYEPALADLSEINLDGIDWVIYGGESGNGTKNFRPQDIEWPRAMRRKCKKHKKAFFHKQSAAVRTEMGIELDGEIVREFPMERRTVAVLPPNGILPRVTSTLKTPSTLF